MYWMSLPAFEPWRLPLLVALLVSLLAASGSAAAQLRWAFPTPAIESFRDPESTQWLQATASGESRSALFGCVRNDGNRFHEGLDIAPVLPRRGPRSVDPVFALHDGRVAHINPRPGDSSYGTYILLEHPGLEPAIYSLYAHLQRVEDGLRAGDRVTAGQRLGIMGNTAGGYRIPHERSHLHLEVGLRLSDQFDRWFAQQSFGSPNRHGSFNGMNLVGWDPLEYLRLLDRGELCSPMDYLVTLPVGAKVHVRRSARPDFLERYPALELPGCEPDLRAGWEVLLSPFGMPLSLRGLQAHELHASLAPGEAAVTALQRDALADFACRDLVRERAGKVELGPVGQRIIGLLFMQ